MPERFVNRREKFVIHPDMLDAFHNYGEKGREAFTEVFQQRDQNLREGLPTHNGDHDAELAEQAAENTDNAICRGWKFPRRNR